VPTYPDPTVTRPDFGGVFVPPDVQAEIVNLVLGGSVLAPRLTRVPTDRQTVTFPTAAPTGAAWYGELERIAQLDLHDSKYEVATAKLAGLVPISNEMLADSVFPITAQIGQLLKDTLAADMDRGLFNGSGVAPQPLGLFPVAPSAAGGADLRAAAIAAWGEMTAAGADPLAITVFAHPALVAVEWGRIAAGAGTPVHADQAGNALVLGPGITIVPAAVLTAGQALAVETTRTYFVEREPISVAVSTEFLFDYDGVMMRIKGRAAVACPNPTRSLRKLTIGAALAAEASAGGVSANADSGSGFDPGKATVSDVKAYVDDHPDQLETVLAAERAGQNRTTLVADLEARQP
jgi:hypothetical protein